MAGTQNMITSGVVALSTAADSAVTFQQGTPATPATGTNGGAPTIVPAP
jgi:hypothetical protein